MAQILLTGEDVDAPVRSEHLRNTFESLLELGVIPVVNENDSVSSAEIETGQCKVLGDNDTLSAMVARLCGADLLVLLSDIDGLYDADPRTHPEAKLIHQVEAVTPELRGRRRRRGHLAGHRRHGHQAPRRPAGLEAGIDMVIANGSRMEALYDIVAGEDVGTRFSGRRQLRSSRRHDPLIINDRIHALRSPRRRDHMTILETQGLAAKNAARVLAVAGTARKNAALEAIAQAIWPGRRTSWRPTPPTWRRRRPPACARPCWTGWPWTQGASPASWRGCGRWPPSPTPSGR